MASIPTNSSEFSAVDDGHAVAAGKGFMLFGVRVLMEGSFRKSASMNNLAQYDLHPHDSSHDLASGYASDDVVHLSGRNRERKRGVPWSEEEHRLFLLGLQRVGKGDWRGISRNYVKTRTPTQVASHAQKYFLRRNSQNRRRRRSSLFDITTDAVAGPAKEDRKHQENTISVSENPTLRQVNQLNNSPKPIRPIPILPVPPSSRMASLDLNLSISSSSSSPPASNDKTPSSKQQSPPIISVA